MEQTFTKNINPIQPCQDTDNGLTDAMGFSCRDYSGWLNPHPFVPITGEADVFHCSGPQGTNYFEMNDEWNNLWLYPKVCCDREYNFYNFISSGGTCGHDYEPVLMSCPHNTVEFNRSSLR